MTRHTKIQSGTKGGDIRAARTSRPCSISATNTEEIVMSKDTKGTTENVADQVDTGVQAEAKVEPAKTETAAKKVALGSVKADQITIRQNGEVVLTGVSEADRAKFEKAGAKVAKRGGGRRTARTMEDHTKALASPQNPTQKVDALLLKGGTIDGLKEKAVKAGFKLNLRAHIRWHEKEHGFEYTQAFNEKAGSESIQHTGIKA